ncbi:MAG TPA: hypothetical protein VGH54_17870 [Mycobacterium sp.]|jgi:hypothetical protein
MTAHGVWVALAYAGGGALAAAFISGWVLLPVFMFRRAQRAQERRAVD